MISGVLIELFGVMNMFCVFVLGGIVVFVIFIFVQYMVGLFEWRENKCKEYELFFELESDGLKSEEL